MTDSTGPRDPRHQLGRQGEELAGKYLEQQGFLVLEKNFRTKYGEIDIIARDGETLVFVEVRAKKHILFGHPLETINPRKQSKIIRMATYYLSVRAVPASMPCRFDVVGIIQGDKAEPEIIHIRNAFQA